MTQPTETVRDTPPPRESIAAVVSRNLVIGRLATELTQHQLAANADVSRATIAQIETGVCDPRLSTLADLADAIGIPPAFLLLGRSEMIALVEFVRQVLRGQGVQIAPEQTRHMEALLERGLIRDWKQAARHGAAAVAEAGVDERAGQVLAALFSAMVPGVGTEIAAHLGRILDQQRD